MSQKRPQTSTLIFSVIAVIAIIAVVFLLNQLTPKEEKTSAQPKETSKENKDVAEDISLTVDGKHVDDTLTGHDSSPEKLVGHISEVIMHANDTGDMKPFINLIGQTTLSPAQITHLQQLAAQSRLKLSQSQPFSAVPDRTDQWVLNFADKEQILLNLKKLASGQWMVDSITLPKAKQPATDGMAKTKDSGADPAKPANTNPATAEAQAAVQQFMDAILKLNPSAAGAFVDTEKISYATLAGLCIIFEEGHYQMAPKKAIRNMFISGNTAGWIVRVSTSSAGGTGKSAMFALSTKRKAPQSPWKITEINLDKLLANYASQLSGGDIHYIPLIKNPRGGDSIVLYFKIDSNELSQRTERQLKIIANLLKSAPEKKLTISGHTDALGSDSYNLNLSNQRAKQVMSFLTSQGIPPQQIKIDSFGKSKPRQPNTTDDGRRANRRAEILLDF